MKIKVKVTPVHGDSHEVEVEPTSARLGDVLKKAKLNPKNMNVSVDGRPVTDMDMAVADGAKVTLTEKTRGS